VLEAITISNFKSLRQVSLEFPRLTLLFGPNSSGKSSVIQMLLAIKQTLESRNLFVPLVLSGRYTQLGSFESVVFGKDTSREILVKVKVRTPRLTALYRTRVAGIERFMVTKQAEGDLNLNAVTFGFTLEYVKSTRRIRIGSSMIADARGLDLFALKFGLRKRAITRLFGRDVDIPIVGREIRIGKARFILALSKFLPTIYSERFREPRDADAAALFRIQRVLSRLPYTLESDFTNKMLYLGPLRDYPKRYYFVTGELPRDVGLKGENVVDLLYYDSRGRKKAGRIINALTRWLEQFGLAKNVRINALPEGLYSLTVDDPQTAFEINVADTGFGVSQVLPVIVECLAAPDDSTLLIEQPEIHVHPRVQAELADLFIEVSKGKTVIVESHSEHLLLRLQRRIAERVISPDEVAIYYFDPSPNGTNIRRLLLDEDGSLKEWPPGFFEEDYQESLERQRAVLRKKEPVDTSQ
jgi:predicted ATPase